ncbi:hypothetical protein AVEN_269700-1 [Araneus ventricosus]|uniref:Uncharacterized protein n=1 Tax=Araneus ventricosus TaxID=182803 RepID=A0A4Y2VCH7_ARAVE|nr:hypothetical protein AVEN_269700-1 [Araneus ventricosus]
MLVNAFSKNDIEHFECCDDDVITSGEGLEGPAVGSRFFSFWLSVVSYGFARWVASWQIICFSCGFGLGEVEILSCLFEEGFMKEPAVGPGILAFWLSVASYGVARSVASWQIIYFPCGFGLGEFKILSCVFEEGLMKEPAVGPGFLAFWLSVVSYGLSRWVASWQIIFFPCCFGLGGI